MHACCNHVRSQNACLTFREYGDEQFKEVFHKAQEALRQGIHPVLIPVGSSVESTSMGVIGVSTAFCYRSIDNPGSGEPLF
ncbi:hypothetical protein ANCDUO_03778 [Ancylostoma duodenale]|uniref:Uncharacterized protein n=1 Tax=Ancylostoma duodenale TaxID=51022 RepID=A0A0C2H8P2_9BILA|nr:hypothetical protein ANCDUO_03778 [Ancylostoma duodenale]